MKTSLKIAAIALACALLPGCYETPSDRGPAVRPIASIPQAQPAPRYRYRSKITGRFVTATYARQHPRTTTRERVR